MNRMLGRRERSPSLLLPLNVDFKDAVRALLRLLLMG